MEPLGQAHRPAVLSLPVWRLMRRNFVTIAPSEPLQDAHQLMRVARLRHLLVAEDGTLVGVLSYRDLQETLLDRFMRGQAATDGTAEHVGSAMRPQPYTIAPDARLYDAATRLCGLRLGCLPVVERRAGRALLVGILTETDLLQAACV